MPLAMQAKLLRVLEEGEIERVGGDKPLACGCARGGGDAPQSGRASAAGNVPRGPVSPRVCFSDCAAAAARDAAKIFACWRSISCGSLREQNNWKPKAFRGKRSKHWSATRGREMCANCATWSSACCCCALATWWMRRRWRARCRRRVAGSCGRRRLAACRLRRAARASRGSFRARNTARGAEAQSSPHDEHGEGAGPRAQPPL